jgi:hypothetical protein
VHAPVHPVSLCSLALVVCLLLCHVPRVLARAPVAAIRAGHASVALLVLLYPLIADTSLAMVTCTTVHVTRDGYALPAGAPGRFVGGSAPSRAVLCWTMSRCECVSCRAVPDYVML